MSISKEQTEHLANLARLKLTAGEKAKFSQEISSILDYVNQLNEVVETRQCLVSTPGQPNWPASPAGGREDEVKTASPETIKQILENAPEKEGRLFKVKAVFE